MAASEVCDGTQVMVEKDGQLEEDGGITLPGYRNLRRKRRCEEAAFVNSHREQWPT